MNEETRDKKKIFEILSKNRLMFAFAGSALAIIAFFMPTYHTVEYIDGLHVYLERTLWIFGLYEENLHTYFHNIEWFGVVEEAKFGIALISISSTIVISISILVTITSAIYTLVAKRKKGVHSSRLVLYGSIGIFVALYAYLFLVPFHWGLGRLDFFEIGPLLFFIGTLLILMGYTVKAKPFLKILSLFLAVGLIFYGVVESVAFFFFMLGPALPYMTPSGWTVVIPLMIQVVILASIAIICALVIIIVNYKLHKKAKKKAEHEQRKSVIE